MKFLAIHTSSKRLIAAAKGERTVLRDLPDSAMQHSVLLMDTVDGVLQEAGLRLCDCDFLACVVGPGSFTGIRVGIATVKGLCTAAEKPALAVTSFDCLAYAEESGKKLALVDAGHGYFYGCGYDGTAVVSSPRYMSRQEAETLIAEGFMPVSEEELPIPSKVLSAGEGLLAAAEALCGRVAPCSELEALYLRKSSAEEGR